MNQSPPKSTKYTFKRYEKKYLLTPEQYEAFMAVASQHIVPDAFHKSLVCSVYYDTDDYELIRRSLSKPVYKEKLRVRSYGVPGEDSPVFVELKKKYKGVVYKRRVQTTCLRAEKWIAGEEPAPADTQITREIDRFIAVNQISPKAFIGSERVSWQDKDDPELRFTFDHVIKWRTDRLSLTEGYFGEDLLHDGSVLMEIKIPSAAPLWLAELLSREKIFPRGFSKYGTCYKNEILKSVFSNED